MSAAECEAQKENFNSGYRVNEYVQDQAVCPSYNCDEPGRDFEPSAEGKKEVFLVFEDAISKLHADAEMSTIMIKLRKHEVLRVMEKGGRNANGEKGPLQKAQWCHFKPAPCAPAKLEYAPSPASSTTGLISAASPSSRMAFTRAWRVSVFSRLRSAAKYVVVGPSFNLAPLPPSGTTVKFETPAPNPLLINFHAMFGEMRRALTDAGWKMEPARDRDDLFNEDDPIMVKDQPGVVPACWDSKHPKGYEDWTWSESSDLVEAVQQYSSDVKWRSDVSASTPPWGPACGSGVLERGRSERPWRSWFSRDR
ncbi:hypothetical protein BDK51DRAFT_40923 [Blyttiomyces helicus]|uniref:Uncharacterized protein n=1 Tax=Blyttiomyces helicus TaxID=388810 RepID=A0A4P9WEE0_9FUNG|nr:hypothetical protein BDK51DRAFT_40923 [Blyttiomyces helicus]|eukprot:RKO91089.1 hypothetical protein BDK51DRAFT_40923 [Blyttiomyces helicus]